MCWLLKQLPIWSIVVYTDDSKWRKPLPKSYWYAFTKDKKKLYHEFDIIKVNKEKSKDLIQKKSLLCKLLALKADDTDISPEDIIRDIYQTVYEMKDSLTDDQLLLVEQFVDYYRKIPQQTFSKIKKEVNMSFAATTITEHYINIGEERGEKRGEKKGEKKGLLKGKLQALQELYEKNIIQKDIFEEMSTAIQEQIKRLTASSRQKKKK